MTDQPLAGKGIVVTRPRQQAQGLSDLIAAAGGKPILFPTIEIIPIVSNPALTALLARLNEFQVAIFVSANAVDQAMDRMAELGCRLPAHIKLIAVGPGTARSLEARGLRDIITPSSFDSEGILELPQLHRIQGLRIIIFRGQGGRELVGATLSQRGAVVERAECYRRGRPLSDARLLMEAWENKALQAITVTSSEGLRNLVGLLGEQGGSLLAATPVFVPHTRIERNARDLGLAQVVLTGHGNQGLVDGMAQWFAQTALGRGRSLQRERL